MGEPPCVAVCKISPQFGFCQGCGRSRAEIEAWQRTAPERRGEILAQLPQRLKRMKPTLGNALRRLLSV